MKSRTLGRKIGCLSLALCLFAQGTVPAFAEENSLAGISSLLGGIADSEAEREDSIREFVLAKSTEGDLSLTKGFAISKVEDYVNIRTGASTDAEIVGKIYDQCGAEVLDSVQTDDGLWYHVRSGSVEGYLKSDFVVTGEEAQEYARQNGNLFMNITEDGIFVREEANTDCGVVDLLAAGDSFTVVGETDDFVQVLLADDSTGYISKDYVDVYIDCDTAISLEEEKALMEEMARLEEEARIRREKEEKEAAEAAYAQYLKEQEESKAAAEAAYAEYLREQEESKAAAEAAYAEYLREQEESKAAAEAEYEEYLRQQEAQRSYEEPAYEEPAYEEPAYEEPAPAEPAYEEPSYEEPAPAEPSYEEPAPAEPAYEEPAPAEPAYEEPAPAESAHEEPAPAEPSYEEPAPAEPAHEEPAPAEPAPTEPAPTEPAYEEPDYEEPSDSLSWERQAVVDYAWSKVGCDYVWGAEGPWSFDCSGLVKCAYAQAGVSLYHQSGVQGSAGSYRSVSEAEPGDILWKSGHVGIYVGDGQCIHASTYGVGVIVSNVWSCGWVCARNVLG